MKMNYIDKIVDLKDYNNCSSINNNTNFVNLKFDDVIYKFEIRR